MTKLNSALALAIILAAFGAGFLAATSPTEARYVEHANPETGYALGIGSRENTPTAGRV